MRLISFIVAIVTNHLNAAVIALATASIGAIYSSTATDMGAQVGIPFWADLISSLSCQKRHC